VSNTEGNAERLINMLHVNSSREDFELAVKEAITNNLDPQLFLQPNGKAYWSKSAVLLERLGYPRIVPVIDGLFDWIKDMNWPGANIVQRILLSIPDDVFFGYYQKAVKNAIETNDEDWLLYLSWYVKKKSLSKSEFSDESLYLHLERYLKEYGEEW
jgi:hypothetical protein